MKNLNIRKTYAVDLVSLKVRFPNATTTFKAKNIKITLKRFY